MLLDVKILNESRRSDALNKWDLRTLHQCHPVMSGALGLSSISTDYWRELKDDGDRVKENRTKKDWVTLMWQPSLVEVFWSCELKFINQASFRGWFNCFIHWGVFVAVRIKKCFWDLHIHTDIFPFYSFGFFFTFYGLSYFCKIILCRWGPKMITFIF